MLYFRRNRARLLRKILRCSLFYLREIQNNIKHLAIRTDNYKKIKDQKKIKAANFFIFKMENQFRNEIYFIF